MAQPEFLLDVLQQIPPLHRAIETSGYAPASVFDEIMKQSDLVLFDIKHTDPVIHKKFTGVDNLIILKNFENLSQSEIPFILRLPIIPGVNDNREHFISICNLIQKAPNLQHVEILPYHFTAGAKYPNVNRKYMPEFDFNKTVSIDISPFEENGFNAIIL